MKISLAAASVGVLKLCPSALTVHFPTLQPQIQNYKILHIEDFPVIFTNATNKVVNGAERLANKSYMVT